VCWRSIAMDLISNSNCKILFVVVRYMFSYMVVIHGARAFQFNTFATSVTVCNPTATGTSLTSAVPMA